MAEKHQVLVVDDEAVIVDAARKMLSIEGFTVQAAGDADAALQLLQTEAPDIALLDLMLPDGSGMDLLHVIQRDYPQTAVIMMTGYSTLSNAIAFMKNGALDYLPKPFAFEELVSTVQRASRFLRIPTRRVEARAQTAPPFFRLGMGSWARAGSGNTARLGITEIYRQMVGPVEKIEFPPLHSHVFQGGLLAQIIGQDQLKHAVWSALSGRIDSINTGAEENLRSAAPDVLEKAWLVRIVTDRFQSELLNLSPSDE
jgi:FixJ family two-component response regulator/glycine cleavage system H lipoate-binding protein